jgi:hypothetical protein
MTVVLSGCSPPTSVAIGIGPSQTPTSSPAPPSSISLSGMVIDEAGVCIEGATLEVVSGQALGRRVTQATPCGAWDYNGGFTFDDLVAGVEMTLRAAASGYTPQEKTIMPSPGAQIAVLLTPLGTK